MARQHDSYAGARKDRHKLHLRRVREREQRDEERRFRANMAAVKQRSCSTPEPVRIVDIAPAQEAFQARGDWDLAYRAFLITAGVVAAAALVLLHLWAG